MTIAEKLLRAKADIDEVHEAGYNKGHEIGVTEGKQAQYDEFWDSMPLWDWTYRFAGRCWNATTFRPKFNLTLSGNCSYCFQNNGASVDLVELCNELGITMSTSNVTGATGMFCYSQFTRLGVIDLTNCGENMYNMFSNAAITTLDKLIVNENTKFNASFAFCSKFENLIIEGTIGQNGLNLQWSTKLSKASITSVMSALSKTTTGLSVTLSMVAVDKAFETSAGANDGRTSEIWKMLVSGRSNWTISLV